MKKATHLPKSLSMKRWEGGGSHGGSPWVGMACKPGTSQVGLGAGGGGNVNQAVIKREGSCKRRGSDLEKGVSVGPRELLGVKEGCRARGCSISIPDHF